MALARFGNRYFDEQAPWRQVKEDRAGLRGDTIGSLLNLINALKVLFAPFLPFTSATAARAARLRGRAGGARLAVGAAPGRAGAARSRRRCSSSSEP